MIATGLLNVIWSIALPILNHIPAISISANTPITSNVLAYIRCALYFFPMGTVMTIFSLVLGLWILRIVIAILKTIWGVIPVL